MRKTFLEKALEPFDVEEYIKQASFPARFKIWKSKNGGDRLKASIKNQMLGAALEFKYEDAGAIHHETVCGDVTTPLVDECESICGNIDLKLFKIDYALGPYLRDEIAPRLRDRKQQFKNVGIRAVHVWFRRSNIAKILAIYPVIDGEIQEPIILESD